MHMQLTEHRCSMSVAASLGDLLGLVVVEGSAEVSAPTCRWCWLSEAALPLPAAEHPLPGVKTTSDDGVGGL